MILQEPFAISTSPTGFNYYSPISINAAQVPSTQTDFPVLVSQTDNRFKTVGNGGHVLNSSGFDIRPYTNSALSTAITGYELERYNASTGEVVMWVKVGSLSSSTTPIYLAYGNASLTTDGSSTTTWSNNFISVYHLKDGTTLSVADSVGSNNGTNHSATAAAGQIDGGAAFVSASTQYIDLGTGITETTTMTFSAWVNATSFPNALNSVIVRKSASADSYFMLFVTSGGKLACFAFNGSDISYNGTGSHTLSTGTWYYLTMAYKNSNPELTGYVNAVSDNTAGVGASGLTSTLANTNIGRDPITSGRYWNGSIDEVRVVAATSGGARSADWITTEYNNQSAPGTFETLGTEVPL